MVSRSRTAARRAALAAVPSLLFLIACNASAELRRVAAVVVSPKDGFKIRHAGTDSFIDTGAGAELIEDDTIKTGGVAALLIGCQGEHNVSFSLPPNSEIALTAGGLPGSAVISEGQPGDCVLPLDDRSDPADVYEARVAALPGNWQLRAPLLAEAVAKRLAEILTPMQQSLTGKPVDLTARIAEARVLERAGLAADAIRAYSTIFRMTKEAVWAARSASRLSAAVAILPDPSTPLDPDPTFAPGLRARAAAAGAPRAGIIDPDGPVYALLIGIGKYPKDVNLEELAYAEKDAELFEKFLRSGRGRRVQNIKVVNSANGTASYIRNALQELVAGHADSKSSLIVFIAAHGGFACLDEHGEPSGANCADSQKEPLILTTDTSGEAQSSTGVSMRTVQKLVAENAYRFGRVLFYIDVCHSGVVRWDKHASAPPPDMVKEHLEPKQGAVGIMMASSQNDADPSREFAYESDQFGHGIFTYYVISNLAKGQPSSGSNTILLDDLGKQVQKEVLEATHLQRPSWDSNNMQTLAVGVDASQSDFAAPERKPGGQITLRGRNRSWDRWVSPLPVTAVTSAAVPAPGPGDVLVRFHRAISAGLLLHGQPDNASDLLTQLKNQTDPKGYAELESLLRVALEDAGQQVLLTYIQGDQVPQTKNIFERGAEYFKAAAALAPGTTFSESRQLFCEGRLAVFDKRYGLAQQLLDRAIRLDPFGAYSYNALGISLLEQVPAHPSYFHDAENAFRDAIRLEPRWAYPLHNLALLYGEQGDNRAAIATYQRAIDIAPAYSYIPYNLGLLYEHVGQFAPAETYLNLAAKRASIRGQLLGAPKEHWVERAAPLTALGTLYLSEGRVRTAEHQFDMALEADPEYVPALHDKGVLRDRKGKTGDAILLWRKALSLDPGYTAARLSMAEAMARQHDFDHAALQYEYIVADHPDYGAALRGWALALISLGDMVRARDLLSLAVLKTPESSELAAEEKDLENVMSGGRPATRAIKAAVGVGGRR